MKRIVFLTMIIQICLSLFSVNVRAELTEKEKQEIRVINSKIKELIKNNTELWITFLLIDEKEFEKNNDELKENPRYPQHHSQLLVIRGRIWMFAGQYDKALEDLNKAIEMDPKDDFAYNSRGETYERMGKYGKAIEDIKKAIEIEPRQEMSKYHLKEVLKRRDERLQKK